MNIKVPEAVYELAEIFDKHKIPLYVVGGYTRSQFLGVAADDDIDLCSKATPDMVKKILSKTNFEIKLKGAKTGVLEISKNGKKFDHATFRRERYDIAGVHTPTAVEYTDSLLEDSDRRDFSINSIYAEILSGDIIDPFNGIKDLSKKVIKTISSPNIVMKNDGIRILRLIRLAATLGFEIDTNTFEAAKRNAYKLQFISKSLIREEFSRIVQADIEYPTLSTSYAHVKGVMLLIELDALKHVIPELEILKKCRDKFKTKISLFDYSLTVFSISPPEVRLSALLFMIGAAKLLLENKRSINGHEKFGAEMAEKILGEKGMGYSREIVERVKKIISVQNFGEKLFVRTSEIKTFISENLGVIDYIIMLKHAIARVNSMNRRRSRVALKMQRTLSKMRKAQTPFFVADLAVKGVDLLEAFPNLNAKHISTILKILLKQAVQKPEINNKTWLLMRSAKILRKNPGFCRNAEV